MKLPLKKQVPQKNLEIEDYPIGDASYHNFVFNQEHLTEKVHVFTNLSKKKKQKKNSFSSLSYLSKIQEQFELPEHADLKELDAHCILDLLKSESQKVWDEHLIHGVDYYGNQSFNSAEGMRHNLTQIVDYTEANTSAAPDIKMKMRYVAKCLKNNKEALGVVVMLASHGKDKFKINAKFIQRRWCLQRDERGWSEKSLRCVKV